MQKVKWGVIGAGGIADRRTIPGMLKAENADLDAVMEINMEFANKLKNKHNARKAYDNVDELLQDKEIEAVYIASPVKFHYEQAVKAASAGKHILLEKPLALTLEQGEEIIEKCRENNVKLASGLMMRFGSYHQKIREMIADGKLGQIVSARAQLTCWYPEMEGDWRQDPDLGGGGSLMDMGIHCLDLLEFLIDSKISKITGFIGTKTFNYKAEDSAAVLFEMENDCAGYVDSNFNIPDEAVENRLEIYGTAGSVLASGTIGQVDGGEVKISLTDEDQDYDAQQERGDIQAQELEVELGDMYTREIESFSRSILEDISVEVSGEIGLRAQKLCYLAYEAAEEGLIKSSD